MGSRNTLHSTVLEVIMPILQIRRQGLEKVKLLQVYRANKWWNLGLE